MHIEDALIAVAAARAADPLRPVTFVVPNRLAALAMRRDLARRTPHAAVRFETLPRLAELAGSGVLAAEGRRPLARPIGDYVASLVAQRSGGALAGVASLPGYARVLRRHFQRLRRGGIRNSSDLRLGPDGPATAEFLRAYDAFREGTSAFYDDEDLFDAAVSAIDDGRSGVGGDLGDIYVVPPAVRTAGGEAFIAALGRAGSPVTVLEDDSARVQPSFVLMPDPASETEAVARRVLELLERGASLHEIAVFHGADSSYPALLASAFRRAEVQVARFPGQPLNETPAGRAVLSLLQLPAQDYSRVAVMDFFALAQSPWTVPGEDGAVPLRPTAWDRLSREAGMTHGAARWTSALRAVAADLRERAANIDEPAWRERVESDARQAEALETVIRVLIARLEPLRERQPAARFISRLKQLVDDYVRSDSGALAEVTDEIDQLGAIAAVGGEFSLDSFIYAFEANLRAASIREGSLGDGVLIADFRAAAGLRFPHVLLCGVHEGAFPPGVGIAPVVDERWWAEARLRHPAIEDGAARLDRERAAARRSLAAATGSLTVVLSVAAASGTQDRYPSPILAELATQAFGETVTPTSIRNQRHEWSQRGRSPLAAASAGPPLDSFERELRQSIAQRQSGVATLQPGHRLERSLQLRRSRRGNRLTEWDGLVEPGMPLLGADQLLSATAVENYSTCGMRFFLGSILRLRALDEPEERQTIDPATRGTIVHKALDRFFTMQQGRDRLRPGLVWDDDDQRELLAILDDEVDRASARGQTGLAIFHAHELASLRADLERFLKEDSVLRAATGAVPADFEWRFSGVEIGGRAFRGAADRVDRSPDGKRAWVIDYKTGRGDDYKEDAADPFKGGSQLQLGIYSAALAADGVEVTGRYWFITQKGEFASVEYTHSAENAARLEEVVGAIEAGVRTGAFPAVPGDEDFRTGFSNCAYCDFDRICSRRRLAEFTARADDPALQRWAAVQAAATRQAGD